MGVDQPTIILSGPVAQRGTAIKQLQQGGFTLAEAKHGWGLPDAEERVEPDDGHPYMVGVEDKSVGWITVYGDDVDGAVELAGGFGYRLRAHHLGTQLQDSPSGGSLSEDRVRELIHEALGEQ